MTKAYKESPATLHQHLYTVGDWFKWAGLWRRIESLDVLRGTNFIDMHINGFHIASPPAYHRKLRGPFKKDDIILDGGKFFTVAGFRGDYLIDSNFVQHSISNCLLHRPVEVP